MAIVDLPELNEGRAKSREIIKLINRIRLRLNLFPDFVTWQALQTNHTATPTVIWGSKIENNTAYKLTASVIGSRADGNEAAAYTIEAGVINAAGVVSFIGGTQQKTFERETNVISNAEFVLTVDGVGLLVQDTPGALDWVWNARVYVEKLR